MDRMNAGRVLGIDYGSKRVGVAVSDPLRVIAQGAGTFDNNAQLIDKLEKLVVEREVALIVVGMPYAPDGGVGAKGGEVERFVESLRSAVCVPIETWDESYTSKEAQQVFVQSGMKRKKRREKSRVDEMAARLILQEYLENGNR